MRVKLSAEGARDSSPEWSAADWLPSRMIREWRW